MAPCYDGRNVSENTVYVDRDNPNDKIEIRQLKNDNAFLEGALCAIITELDTRGLTHEVFREASRRGLIGLMEFWEKHKKDDESRLANILHKFSIHEQNMMRKLLNEGK